MGSAKKIFDLYGVNGADLEAARALVENAIGIVLQPHESSYHGGEYFRLGDPSGEAFILQSNYDTFESEWAESEHRDAPFLLYVGGAPRADELKAALATASIQLLRRELV